MCFKQKKIENKIIQQEEKLTFYFLIRMELDIYIYDSYHQYSCLKFDHKMH